MSKSVVASVPAVSVEGGNTNATRLPTSARARKAVGFSSEVERAFHAAIVGARLYGGSEARLEMQGYAVTVQVRHSKESSMPAIEAKEAIALAAAAVQQRRQQEWIDKSEQAPPAAMQEGATAKPSARSEKKARARRARRAREKEEKRELKALREQLLSQPPPSEMEEEEEQDGGQAQQQEPPPADQAVQETALLRQAVERISSQFAGGEAFACGKGSHVRHVVLPTSSERVPVTVKAGTMGARWDDEDFGKRLYDALRGTGGAPGQLDEALAEFINKQIAAPAAERESAGGSGHSMFS